MYDAKINISVLAFKHFHINIHLSDRFTINIPSHIKKLTTFIYSRNSPNEFFFAAHTNAITNFQFLHFALFLSFYRVYGIKSIVYRSHNPNNDNPTYGINYKINRNRYNYFDYIVLRLYQFSILGFSHAGTPMIQCKNDGKS